MQIEQARKILHAVVTLALVACGAAVQDERAPIASAICEHRAACDASVDVVACESSIEPTLSATCSTDESSACRAALASATCGESYETIAACAPCHGG